VHIFSLSGNPVRAPTGVGENQVTSSQAERTSSVVGPPSGSERYHSQSVDGAQTVFRQSDANNSVAQSSASISTQSQSQGSDHANRNMAGMGNFLKGFLPSGFVPKYFESEWSFAQVRGIESRSVCAFSKDSSKIVVVSADGNFIVASVEEGECPRLSTTKYLKSPEEVHPEDEIWSSGATNATHKT
jgi:hypothetical protein